MWVLLIRYFLFFYFIGIFCLFFLKMANKSKKQTGLLAVILFPLMILTRKGRNNLFKGIE